MTHQATGERFCAGKIRRNTSRLGGGIDWIIYAMMASRRRRRRLHGRRCPRRDDDGLFFFLHSFTKWGGIARAEI